ncbi:phage tail protein [Gracilibacillus saliphilus]|uniref:phage tail protein n=1 Tax=Gracilibacillus saliphilus TaxID=543890 RepID=UPI0013D22004|nr:hypothetical protein [Gracilibacillus saliphilus]
MQIFKLFGSILIDDKEAQNSLSKTDKKAKGMGDRLRGGIKTAAKWGAALVAGATIAIGGMTSLALKVGQTADEILDLSATTGMSTDEIQKWRKATEEAGTSTDAVADASAKLTRNLDTMSSESNKGNKALQELGLSLTEVENMSADERMNVLTDALAGVDDETQRAKLGTDLFGGSWKDLAPVVDMGTEAMKNAKDNANVFSEEDLNRANNFRMMYDELKERVKFFAMEIGMQLIPMLEVFFGWVQDSMPTIRDIFDNVFTFIGEIISKVVEGVQSFVEMIRTSVENNQEQLTRLQEIFQERLMLVWEIIQTILENIKVFWQENGQAILDNAIQIFTAIQETVQFALETAWQIIQQILALVVPFIQEKLIQIKQFWDENGQQIMQAVQNAFKFIQGVIETVMPIIQGIIEYVWSQISTIIDTTIGIIMGLIKTFASLLTGDFEGVKEGLLDIWNALWDGIKGLVSNAWGMLSGAFSGLWESISGWFSGLKDDAINWGKNMISGFIDGMLNMGPEIARAAEDVVKKAGEFLKFWSPAKKGEGRYIVHWGRNMIDGFLDGVRAEGNTAGAVMNDVVGNMKPSQVTSGNGNREVTKQDNSMLEELLTLILEAIKEGKNIVMNDKIIAKETGDARAEDDGKRVRHTERRLAT